MLYEFLIIPVIAIILIILSLIILYSLYVSLIKKKNKVLEALSSVDVQLKKRYDLIPNILKIASRFMEHEKAIFEEIAKIRTEASKLGKDYESVKQKLELNELLKTKISQLNVSLENYPELKSDSAIVASIQAYNDAEENIAAARRFFNSAVLELNNAVEIFPSSLIALFLNIKKQDFFEIDKKESAPINASDYLK